MNGRTWIVWFFLGCFLNAQIQASNVQNEKAKKILNALLDEGTYDSDLAPNDDGTEVKVNMYVRDIDIVDKARGELHLQLVLRQTWNDPRLANGRSNQDVPPSLTLKEVEKIWTPDVHIENQIDEDHPTQEFAAILPDGDVVLSQRLNVKTVCYMNLTEYPMDDQKCSIRLASYSYTSKSVNLVWDQPSVELSSLLPPYIGQFKLRGHNNTKCNSTSSRENHGCIETTFNFGRNLRFALFPILRISAVALGVAYVIACLNPEKYFLFRLLTCVTSSALLCVITATDGAGRFRDENGMPTMWGEISWSAQHWLLFATYETIMVYAFFISEIPLFACLERWDFGKRLNVLFPNRDISIFLRRVCMFIYLIAVLTYAVQFAYFLPAIASRLD